MNPTSEQKHSSLDVAFRAPEKNECLTRNEASESMSTNVTHSETDKPLLIKTSNSEHKPSPHQGTKLDEHQPTVHGNGTADMPMDTRIKQEELSKKPSLPRTSDSGRVA